MKNLTRGVLRPKVPLSNFQGDGLQGHQGSRSGYLNGDRYGSLLQISLWEPHAQKTCSVAGAGRRAGDPGLFEFLVPMRYSACPGKQT